MVGTEGRYTLVNNPPLRIKQLQDFFELFNNSEQRLAIQQADGSYLSRIDPPTPTHYAHHLNGRWTLAAYATNEYGQSKWACFDSDDPEGFERLKQVQADLENRAIFSLLESSRRGGHLWFFMDNMTGARRCLQFTEAVRALYDLKTDVFPKTAGLGGCVRLPLGIHRKTGQKYPLWDPRRKAFAAQYLPTELAFILRIGFVTHQQIDNLHARALELSPGHRKNGHRKNGHRIVHTVPSLKVQQLREFLQPEHIGFEPDRSGMMSCPLHPPDRHPSFHWNEKERLWCCFHENIGGDLIDLWRRVRNDRTGIPREQAIDELYRFMLEDRHLQRPPPTPHAS